MTSDICDDVEFIFSECARFQSEISSGRKVSPNSSDAMEFFYRLPHPKVSWSFMICGQAADKRLRRLSDLAARNAGLNGRIATKTVRDELAAILVRKFINEHREIDHKNVSRSMAEAAKRAARKAEDVTHFIPCHLMLCQQPDSFNIGPVSFLTQRSFRTKIIPQVLRNRQWLRKNRRTFRQVLKYYRSFGWIAEVTIKRCDPVTSEEVAIAAVTAALNCLQLLFGADYTHKMLIAGPNLSQDLQGKFVISGGEGLGYSLGYVGAGSVAFNDDWHKLLEPPDEAHLARLCGLAVNSIVERQHRPLSSRFLDAVSWFGEAVRDKSPAGKVVRYTTALERMVMTEERDDISATISHRVAAICCSHLSEDYDEILREMRKLIHTTIQARSWITLPTFRGGPYWGSAWC